MSVDEVVAQVTLFYSLYLSRSIIVESCFAAAELLLQFMLQFLDREAYVVFEQGDVLAYAFHPLAH